MSEQLADQVSGVAVLAEPVRRELYLFVVAAPGPVSRDEAADGVGVARHTAKFHLDKLVEQGLLDVGFQRRSGRRGPGAGRPAKLYRRSGRQVTVNLPERRYDVAAGLLARAVEDATSTGVAVADSLHAAAAARGSQLGRRARQDAAAPGGGEQLLAAAGAALAEQGYEPRREGATITLVNCPFHDLAREHTALVCGMNLALLEGVGDGLGDGVLTARLEPSPDRCCVVLSAAEG